MYLGSDTIPPVFEKSKFERCRKRILEDSRRQIARESANSPTAQKLFIEQMERLDELNIQMWQFESEKILSNARKLDLEMHFAEEVFWESLPQGVRVLSTTGRRELRRAIDEEKSRRREIASWWWKTIIIPGLAAATGLVGALTGMFAVLHHK
ncbi:MAG TPA: hypothetical protein VGR47_05210 [Terracidiphilus sp.]|nr:hypothetical protein [Terracidiphilus sp.]